MASFANCTIKTVPGDEGCRNTALMRKIEDNEDNEDNEGGGHHAAQ